MAGGGQLALDLAEDLAGSPHLLEPADDREEDGHGVLGADPQERAQLRLQHVEVAEQEPDASLRERWVPRGGNGK